MWRFLGWAAVVAAALYFLYIVRASLIPFLIGGVIALLLNPFVEALCRKGYSRGRAILNVFLAFLLLTLGLGLMLAPAFYAQARAIIKVFPQPKPEPPAPTAAEITPTQSLPPQSTENTPPKSPPPPQAIADQSPEPPSQRASSAPETDALTSILNRWTRQAEEYLQKELTARQGWVRRSSELLTRLGLPTEPGALAKELTSRFQERAKDVLLDNAAAYLNTFLGALLGFLSRAIWLILIPMSAYFFLLDMPSLQKSFLFMVPPAQRAAVRQLMSEIGTLFFRYIRGIVTASLTYGAVSMLFYWLVGAPNPVLLGVLAAILYPIPYLGAFLIALSAFVFTLIFGGAHPVLFLFSPPTLWHAIVVVLGAMIVNNIFDLLITPRLLGGAVGLRPLGALIAIVVGSNWGIWGMLLAVPVATTLKIIIERLLYFFYGESDFLELPESPAEASELPPPPPKEPANASTTPDIQGKVYETE